MSDSLYTNGEYLNKHPDWHASDAPVKAKQIISIINNNNLEPQTICEVGCGSGEILSQLSTMLNDSIHYYGYDISPQAYELCKTRETKRLSYYCADLLETNESYDLVLCIDVFEHVDDYIGFLKTLRERGTYKVFRIPLDLKAIALLRSRSLLGIRKQLGHVHYFTKETALATLVDAGYQILDSYYVGAAKKPNSISIKERGMRLLHAVFYSLNKDIAVRLLGRRSLLVLAK